MSMRRLVLVAAGVILTAGWYTHLRDDMLDARWLWLLAFATLSLPFALSLVLCITLAWRWCVRRLALRQRDPERQPGEDP